MNNIHRHSLIRHTPLIRHFGLLLFLSFCAGCAPAPNVQVTVHPESGPIISAATAAPDSDSTTPDREIRRCLDSALTALKALDLSTFDTYTDNRQEQQSPFGTTLEYTMFGELSEEKGGLEKTDPAYIFDQEVMKHLSWSIVDIAETGSRAKVTVEITNLDMTGIFERFIFVTRGPDVSYMIDEIRKLSPGDTRTVTLTLPATQNNDTWIFQIDTDFVNAVMGNIWYISPDFEEITESHFQSEVN